MRTERATQFRAEVFPSPRRHRRSHRRVVAAVTAVACCALLGGTTQAIVASAAHAPPRAALHGMALASLRGAAAHEPAHLDEAAGHGHTTKLRAPGTPAKTTLRVVAVPALQPIHVKPLSPSSPSASSAPLQPLSVSVVTPAPLRVQGGSRLSPIAVTGPAGVPLPTTVTPLPPAATPAPVAPAPSPSFAPPLLPPVAILPSAPPPSPAGSPVVPLAALAAFMAILLVSTVLIARRRL